MIFFFVKIHVLKHYCLNLVVNENKIVLLSMLTRGIVITVMNLFPGKTKVTSIVTQADRFFFGKIHVFKHYCLNLKLNVIK